MLRLRKTNKIDQTRVNEDQNNYICYIMFMSIIIILTNNKNKYSSSSIDHKILINDDLFFHSSKDFTKNVQPLLYFLESSDKGRLLKYSYCHI